MLLIGRTVNKQGGELIVQAIRRRDPEASRTAILDAAEQQFVRKGYSGTSMREIAKLTGKSQGLIHHYFGSKKALWDTVKKKYGDQFGKVLIPLLEREQIDTDFIKTWARRYLSFFKENPNLSRIMLWRQLEGDQEPWEATNELYELAKQKFKESQEKGLIRSDLDLRHATIIINGAHLTWLREKDIYCMRDGLDPNDPDIDEAYLKGFVKIFLDGILTR